MRRNLTQNTALVALLALALLAPLLGFSPFTASAENPSPISVKRVYGANRLLTAVEVSKEFFPDGATDVVLATAETYPDALSAAPLARLYGAPILLTRESSLAAEVTAEIKRLGATKVTIIGGTQAVSDSVSSVLTGQGLNVERLFGADRYATAAAVASKVVSVGGEVAIVRGVGDTASTNAGAAAQERGFADALAASTLGMSGTKVATLLTTPTMLPQATASTLASLKPAKTTVVGGDAAVSPSVYGLVASFSPSINRIRGLNRYATAIAVAKSVEQAAGHKAETLIFTTGQAFPDSLVGGSLTQRLSAPLITVPSDVPAGTGSAVARLQAALPELADYLIDHCGPTTKAIILGGENAVSPAMSAAITALLTCDSAEDDQTPGGGGGGGTPSSSTGSSSTTTSSSTSSSTSTSTSTTSSTSTSSTTSTTTSSTTSTTTSSTTSTTEAGGDDDDDGPGPNVGDGLTIYVADSSAPITGFNLTPPEGNRVTHPSDIASQWTSAVDGQTGVDSDAFENPARVALVNGTVLDQAGQALEGVTISVVDSANLGSTKTKSNGHYLIALNGGTEVVLHFEKDGYLPSQRRFNLAWGEWRAIDDVVLLQRAGLAQEVSLDDGSTVYVGDETPADEGDEGTARTPRIYLPAGTTATPCTDLTTPCSNPGTVINPVHLHITEYTAGELGFNAMPGDLPPAIGYTYAAEIFVEGAEGAARVDLSKPASMYLDNFLNIAVGTAVPLGFYETDPAVWVPSPDGLVIEVLTNSGGDIKLDLVGKGHAATPGELDAIGIDEAELVAIANQFSTGDEFWRVQLPHFSSPDLNYPVGPANEDGLVEPPNLNPIQSPPGSPTAGEPTENGYGTIMLESAAMSESLPIYGTPYSLTHVTNRLPGHHAQLEVPVWTDSEEALNDPELLEISAQLLIAGRTIDSGDIIDKVREDGARSVTFTWDGLDAFGNRMVGSQQGLVKVTYRYRGYYLIPAGVASSFGVTPDGSETFAKLPVPPEARRFAEKTSLSRVTLSAQMWDATGIGLGGWGISVNHVYDPVSRTVMLGDGGMFQAAPLGGELSLVTGAKYLQNCGDKDVSAQTDGCGDGGQATAASVNNFQGIGVSPDGWIYLLDMGGSYIRRIDPKTGDISHFAGTGVHNPNYGQVNDDDYCLPGGGYPSRLTGPCGDGGSALAAPMKATDLAFGRDGTVYIGDSLTNRVRKIDPATGIITNVVGDITAESRCTDTGPCGDGGLATQAELGWAPSSCFTPERLNIAVGPDDSLYVEHGSRNRIRRVGADGIIETIFAAPGGKPCFGSDVGSMSYHGLSDKGRQKANPTGTTATLPVAFPNIGDAVTNKPSAVITDLLVRADGTVLFTDAHWSSMRCPAIWALSPTGSVTLFAGKQSGTDGARCDQESRDDDGRAAAASALRPMYLAEAPDGSILVASGHPVSGLSSDWHQDGEAGNDETGVCDYGLRRINSDGTLTTLLPWDLGICELPVAGQSALTATGYFQPVLPAVAPDGTVLVGYPTSSFPSDDGGDASRVFALGELFPGFGANELVVPTPDGENLLIFDHHGRHLRTNSASTGARIVSFTYDGQGRLSTITDGDDRVTTINRNEDDQPASIVGPYGHTTGLSVGGDGWLAAVTEPAGATTNLETNAGGQLTKVIGASTTAGPREYSFTYNSLGRLASASSPETGSSTLSTLRAGQTTKHTLTAPDGLVSSVEVTALSNGTIRRKATTPSGLVTAIEIMTDGSQKITEPDGTITVNRFAADPRFGLAVPYVATSTMFGNADQFESNSPAQTLSNNRSFDSVTGIITETVTRDGQTRTSVFDPASRTYTVTLPNGYQSTIAVDNLGRVLETNGSLQPKTTWDRDSDGRIVSISQTPVGGGAARVITRSWDSSTGHLVSETNAASEVVSFVTDTNGRVTKITRPDGNHIGVTLNETGQLVALTTAENTVFAQSFDLEDRLASFTTPDTGDDATALRSYNSAGLLSSITRPGEASTTYIYDNGRFTNRGGEALGTTWAYNSAGQLAGATSDDGAEVAFSYEGKQLSSETHTLPTSGTPITGIITHGYDSQLRPSQDSIAGLNIGYTYDDNGLIISSGAETIIRDNAGLITSRTIGNITVTYDYNGFGELESTTATDTANNTELFKEALTRDQRGRVVSRSETVDGVTTTWSYAYDPLGQLVSATENGDTRSYGYDRNGNLVSGPNGAVGTYDARDRLQTYSGNTYTFDAAGDLNTKVVNGKATQFTYDAAGLLRRLDVPRQDDGSDTVEYLHDGLDRRVARVVNDQLDAAWLYDLAGRPVVEYGSDGAVRSHFVYGVMPNTPDYLVQGGENFVVVSDWRGSPRLVVGSNGEIKERLDYNEFGAITNHVVDTTDNVYKPIPFGFQGGLVEPATGLVRFGARDYDPALGRFTTSDPIYFNGAQTNLYQFAQGDPINRADLSGLGPNQSSGGGKPWNITTAGVGLGGSLGPLNGGAQVGVASDGKRPAVQVTVSWGTGLATTGAEAGVTGYLGTGQGELSDGVGFANNVGATAGGGFGGGVDYGVDATTGDQLITTSAGAVLGAEGHYSQSATLTITGPEFSPVEGAQQAALDSYNADFGPRW